jgi:hypothetical protein
MSSVAPFAGATRAVNTRLDARSLIACDRVLWLGAAALFLGASPADPPDLPGRARVRSAVAIMMLLVAISRASGPICVLWFLLAGALGSRRVGQALGLRGEGSGERRSAEPILRFSRALGLLIAAPPLRCEASQRGSKNA